MIVEAFREASETPNITAMYCFRKKVMHHYGITGDEPYICPIEPRDIVVSTSAESNVHAGDIATSTLLRFYPELVDVHLAQKLPPVKLSDDQAMEWLGVERSKNYHKLAISETRASTAPLMFTICL